VYDLVDYSWGEFGLCGRGHTVAGILLYILYMLDLTNVFSIPLATVGTSKWLPSDMCLISCLLIFVMINAFVSFH